ncbi:LAQU0S16e02168g1_1 [Lachancea quebecensis]|uniref:Derlin n=1 Tax=Lachancea quebecensis TaxID=1654605 RepID=A0A0N7MM93_9SACH|nr:LAQU0S16e02168g1_1 [Lachancea quebecensis]
MDILLLNLVGDIPVVTKVWMGGVVAMSVLSSTTVIDPTKFIYNYDLVFKKGQFTRVLYSLFDYGEFNLMYFVQLFFLTQELASLEKLIPQRSQFLWMIFMMGALTIIFSKWIQPFEPLAGVLHKNLTYYKLRRDLRLPQGPQRPQRGLAITPLTARVCFDAMLMFERGHALRGVLLRYLAGHLYYFLEQVVSKVYNVDLCKPPNKWFAAHEQRHEEEAEQLQE